MWMAAAATSAAPWLLLALSCYPVTLQLVLVLLLVLVLVLVLVLELVAVPHPRATREVVIRL